MTINQVTKVNETEPISHLVLDNRNSLSIKGTKEVLSFKDDSILLDTNMGILVITGEKLKILNVSKKNMTTDISGKINSIEYKKLKNNQSFFKNLFK